MTLFDILFGGVVWQRNEKISANNNGKRSLEDSKFMSFWRAEVRGGKEKNDGETKLLSLLLFSISTLSLLLSLPCPSYHICRVHLSRVDAHSPPTCYLSFHGNWVATVLHKYIL